MTSMKKKKKDMWEKYIVLLMILLIQKEGLIKCNRTECVNKQVILTSFFTLGNFLSHCEISYWHLHLCVNIIIMNVKL